MSREKGIFEQVLDNMDASVYASDFETDALLYLNYRAKARLGLTDDALGKPCWQMLMGKTERCAFCPKSKIPQQPGQAYEWENHMSVLSTYLRNSGQTVTWPGGRLAYVQYSFDVSDLRNTQERLDVAEEASSSGIWEVDIERKLMSFDDAFKKLMRVTVPSPITLSQFADHIEANTEPGRYAGYLDYMRNHFDASRAAGFQNIEYHFSGEPDPVYITSSAKFIGGEDGRPRRIVGMSMDTTNLRVAELKLERRLAQQALMSRVAQSFVNSARIAEAFDASLSDVAHFLGGNTAYIYRLDKGQDAFELVHNWADDRANLAALNVSRFTRQQALLGGLYSPDGVSRVDCAEIPVESADGSGQTNVLTAHISAPLIVDDALWGFVGISTIGAGHIWSDSDVSLLLLFSGLLGTAIGRNLLQEQLERAIVVAQEASSAKSDFLSRMSHEIRTPMNAVLGMTRIGIAAKSADRMRHCLEKIDVAAGNLLELINQILDMSKIEANMLELDEHPFSFDSLISDVCTVMSVRVQDKSLQLSVSIQEDMPRWFDGDSVRISQIVTNLLGNAVKFTPEGGAVSLSAELLEDLGESALIRVAVTDTGIGIEKDAAQRIFRSFEQADGGTSRKYGGTGLGLSICEKLVTMMGGEIWVESEVGHGATFLFTLRLRKCKDAPAIAEQKDALLAFGQALGDLSGKRILLAEDVEVNREIMMALLEDTGVEVDCAENGLEALNLIQRGPEDYDLILMDVQMPEMDGLEATRRIRALAAERAKTVPIVAMTANVFKEDVDRCIAAGMDDHLAKPIDLAALQGILGRYLG